MPLIKRHGSVFTLGVDVTRPMFSFHSLKCFPSIIAASQLREEDHILEPEGTSQSQLRFVYRFN